MLRFRKEYTVQVIENFDEKTDQITDQTEETFKQGEEVDADIYEEREDVGTVDIQFGDGSICLGVPKDCIEVI